MKILFSMGREPEYLELQGILSSIFGEQFCNATATAEIVSECRRGPGPYIVVLPWDLSDDTKTGLLSELRQLSMERPIYTIVADSDPNLDAITRSLELGADDFLPLPVTSSSLERRYVKTIRSLEAQRMLQEFSGNFMKSHCESTTPLCEIMSRHGSDKGGPKERQSWHNYTVYYDSVFRPWRDRSLAVFELGLGTNNSELASNMGSDGKPGASLRGWAEYFPKAKIYGADIDRAILFKTDRIQTFYCDQLDPASIQELWAQPALKPVEFDILIEDGLHTFEANVCFLENSLHKLAKGGMYIAEDLQSDTVDRLRECIPQWQRKFPDCQFELLASPLWHNYIDNRLLAVTRDA